MIYKPADQELQQYTQKESERFWHDAGSYMITDGYDLTPGSVVMDVGGYKGDFTATIRKRYNCTVHVYEPAGLFYQHLASRFNDPFVRVHPYGLEDRDYVGPISRFEEASSMYYTSFDLRDERVNIHDVAKEIEIPIDLMALNCEGGEYGILERLIDTDQIIMVKNLLIQFHPFISDCQHRRNAIRSALKETHNEKFSYDFCWEAWTRK